MRLHGRHIGFALPERHFSMPDILHEVKRMVSAGAKVYPLFLAAPDNDDEHFLQTRSLLEQITGHEMMTSSLADETGEEEVPEFDLLVIAPCTGNFLSMLLNARTTTAPISKALRHLQNGRPVVMALVANGDSENLFQNVAQVLNLKNFYLVPFGPILKEDKQVFLSRLELLYDTILYALARRQLRPVYLESCWLPH